MPSRAMSPAPNPHRRKQVMSGRGLHLTRTASSSSRSMWGIGRKRPPQSLFYLERRLANRIQLTTDDYKACVETVDAAFGGDADYAMLAKIYAPSQVDLHEQVIFGNPAPEHISMSLVKRQNLTMSMAMRLFTRRNNAFSKKIVNHATLYRSTSCATTSCGSIPRLVRRQQKPLILRVIHITGIGSLTALKKPSPNPTVPPAIANAKPPHRDRCPGGAGLPPGR